MFEDRIDILISKFIKEVKARQIFGEKNKS